MKMVLLTGGSGLLGRQVIPHLLARGARVRVIGRRPGQDAPGLTWIQGNLRDPAALHPALAGADAVLHLATQPLKAAADLAMAEALFEALPGSDVRHLVYMSIAGLERMQRAPYYREKLDIESRLEASGLPVTIQRSTQFHGFVAELLGRLTLGPLTLVPPSVTLQLVEARAVAAVLTRRTLGDPAGRLPDLAGPDAWPLESLARSWRTQRGRPGTLLRVPLPLPLFRAWQGQAALAQDAPVVGRSWATWLAAADREQPADAIA